MIRKRHQNQTVDVKFFCDSQTLIEKGKFGYLILKGNVSEVPNDLKTNERVSIHNIDGIDHLVLKCRPKFIRALHNISANNSPRLYIHINQLMTGYHIKKYLYNIWLDWYNVMARKSNHTDFCNYRRDTKLGKIKKVDGYIKHLTDGSVSIKEASKWSI